ncbi:MAG: ABC transporter permease, partial [Candidatus Latescibacterota bacterium]
MLRNYLIVAWRNLWRNRVYAVVSVCGLAVALVVVLIVFLFVRAELTWDRFHANAECLYQAYLIRPEIHQFSELNEHCSFTPNALGSELVANVPGIHRAVRTSFADHGAMALLRSGDQVVQEQGLYADPGFFELFTFPLIQGDPATALAAPGSVVITRRLATKLFGPADPLGQALFLSHQGTGADFTVTGVAADPPYASNFDFDWVAPFNHYQSYWHRPGP